MDLLKTNVSTAMLSQRIEAWSKAAGVALPRALEYQGGLLVKDLVASAGPRNKNKAEARALRDVKSVFAVGPTEAFTQAKRGGRAGMTWLYSTPKTIVGALNSDIQPNISAIEARRILSESRNQPRGKAWIKLKERGKQTVQQWNRVLIGRSKLEAVAKMVYERFGLQKAAWAVGWDVLKVSGRLPNWIRKHIVSGAAKGVLVNRLANPEKPYLQLISRATGVEHAKSLLAIRAAVKKRYASLLKDMRLYLNGTKKAAGFK